MIASPPRRLICMACLAWSALPCHAADTPPDPIEGKWWGMAGFPTDRVEIGIEFKKNDKGEIVGFLHQPVANYYATPFPGTFVRSKDDYVDAAISISLTLRDGKLEGTYFPKKAPISLERTDKLPMEVPVPEFSPGPGPVWKTKLGGAIYAAAEVRDGIAYVGSGNGVFYALDTKDGRIVWMFSAGRPIHAPALATDDAVFFPCDNGFLFKLDRKTGKEVWRYDLGDAQSSRVLVHPETEDFDWDLYGPRPMLLDGVLYVGAGDGGFHAVDAAAGTRKWHFETKGKIRGEAFPHGPNVIFGGFDMHMYAVDRLTGKEAWKKMTGGPISTSAALVGDKVVVGNRGSALVALDATSGEKLWLNMFWGSAVESAPVPYESVFYIGSSDLRRVSCIDPAEGRVLWRTDVYGWAWGRPAVTDSAVYIGAVGSPGYEIRHLGSLCAMDRNSGKMLWRWPMPEWPGSLINGFAAAPTIDGKKLLIGGLDGCLYAFPIG